MDGDDYLIHAGLHRELEDHCVYDDDDGRVWDVRAVVDVVVGQVVAGEVVGDVCADACTSPYHEYKLLLDQHT